MKSSSGTSVTARSAHKCMMGAVLQALFSSVMAAGLSKRPHYLKGHGEMIRWLRDLGSIPALKWWPMIIHNHNFGDPTGMHMVHTHVCR